MNKSMELLIDRKSIKPIYEQIVDQIKEQVMSGGLKPGDQVTSVRVLASELQIGALTVQKAYDILQKQGIIEGVVGKGTIISKNSIAEVELAKDIAVENKIRELVETAQKYNTPKEQLIKLLEMYYEQEVK